LPEKEGGSKDWEKWKKGARIKRKERRKRAALP
jgi:hypothetical protein